MHGPGRGGGGRGLGLGLGLCPALVAFSQAVIGVAFSLAFTLGPMLGASLSVEMAPWLSLFFAVSNLLFIFCFLPETLPPEKRVGLEAGSCGISPQCVPLSGARGAVPPSLASWGPAVHQAVLFLKQQAPRLPGRHPPSPWASALLLTCSAPWPYCALQLLPVARTHLPETVRSLPSTAGLSMPWLPGPEAHLRPLLPCRARQPARPGPGLLPLPLPLLWSRVHSELSGTPALPV